MQTQLSHMTEQLMHHEYTLSSAPIHRFPLLRLCLSQAIPHDGSSSSLFIYTERNSSRKKYLIKDIDAALPTATTRVSTRDGFQIWLLQLIRDLSESLTMMDAEFAQFCVHITHDVAFLTSINFLWAGYFDRIGMRWKFSKTLRIFHSARQHIPLITPKQFISS